MFEINHIGVILALHDEHGKKVNILYLILQGCYSFHQKLGAMVHGVTRILEAASCTVTLLTALLICMQPHL